MIEASVSVQEFPWLESDAQNGFRVYVNPVPYTAIQSPLTAPHAAETFIKVTPSLHSLAGNCVGSGHLSTAGGGFYDPEGMNCVGEKLEDVIYEFFSCRTATYVSKPNSSSVCGPLATWVLTSALSSDMTGVVQDEQINAISMDRVSFFLGPSPPLYAFIRPSFPASTICPGDRAQNPHRPVKHWPMPDPLSLLDLR